MRLALAAQPPQLLVGRGRVGQGRLRRPQAQWLGDGLGDGGSGQIHIQGDAAGREIERDAWRHFGRESLTGLCIGAPCGLLLGAGATVWHGEPAIGLIVAISLFLVMTVSAAIGSIVPNLFRRMNIDPAIAAGPFVTTANDLIGIAIYMAVAATVLSTL